MKVARVITEKNNIEGTIYEAGFDEKSHFNYLYEPEKKILHIYDDRSYFSTSAVNSVNEIVAEIDKIITGEVKGLNKFTQNFISLFLSRSLQKLLSILKLETLEDQVQITSVTRYAYKPMTYKIKITQDTRKTNFIPTLRIFIQL